jgi:TPR repeat protein
MTLLLPALPAGLAVAAATLCWRNQRRQDGLCLPRRDRPGFSGGLRHRHHRRRTDADLRSLGRRRGHAAPADLDPRVTRRIRAYNWRRRAAGAGHPAANNKLGMLLAPRGGGQPVVGVDLNEGMLTAATRTEPQIE